MNGRKVALIVALVIGVGAILVAGGLAARKPVAQYFDPARRETGLFAGQWKNLDAQKPGITRIEIGRSWPGIKVKMWSKCQPQDCDWGKPTSYENRNAAKGALSLVWDDGALRRTQQLALLPDGRLRLQTRIADHATRQETEKIEYFARAAR